MKKFIIGFILLLSSASKAQYIEEIGSLESIYENRVRSVLNTILRPTDYSVVVSVELDRDETKLKEFRDELEINYLPGMPMMGQTPALPSTTNKLHELKVKTDVTVVLSRNVNPDVEKVIKDLVTSKLHLEADAGDVISIKRISLPSDPKEEIKPDLLPDLSWKMWALFIICALLLTAGLAFYAWKRNKKDSTPEVFENHEFKHPEEQDDKKDAEEKLPALPEISNDLPFEVPGNINLANLNEPYHLMDLETIKQHMLTIAQKYPKLASRSIADHALQNSAYEVSLAMEYIGWENAKEIFSEIPSVVWSKIGLAIKENKRKPTNSVFEQAIREVYKTYLAAYIEHEMNIDEASPFGFVLKMRAEDRAQLLDKESAQNVAVLCAKSPAEVTANILDSLRPEKKLRVLAEIARVEKISYETLQSVITSFQQKYNDLKNKPEPRVEGAKLLANVIRGMPPEEEMQLLQMFAEENPDELERVRKAMLIFDDLKLIPFDILAEELTSYEVESLYTALFQAPPQTISAVLRALPQRKAMTVERELQDTPNIPTKKDTARLRRQMIERISKALQARAISVSDLVEGKVQSFKSA